ncbi:hypothetical protein CWR48_00465 [Oceanobacillus arenosus]|uniref:SH3b domain-containing protein n=1 Tax=Oceanobacillus arenosus TaxID=1229153 RepID=A0A3D8Q1W2_9BACI|nr:cell wall-binding repeat-containing protein [Oceanobacillus arenosus]RDW22213.1 hypothetical protein CWR48_00465 [Oceanobacillus arenosus]
MKHNQLIKYLFSMILLSLVLILPFQVGAEEVDTYYFNNGETKEQLTETKEILVSNGDVHSKLSIIEGGKEIFNKELFTVKVSSLKKVVIDNQNYAIITYRYDGSSNALYFEVLKLDETGAESVYSSDVYERARINIEDNQITLNYPEFEEGDIMTEPSKIVTQTFSITNNIVVEGKRDIENSNILSSDKKIGALSENPSYAEVNKILTEESLKAGVAPEIVKAIAFQESGWQQDWTVVPDRVKACKAGDKTLAYDDTNVKLGYDCIGIGIMQISNHMYLKDGPEKEKYIRDLKTNIRFNIQEGIKILKDKWNYSKAKTPIIPTINNDDPMVIENWYFAIMAYNGMLPRNNPLENPYTAYQEKVFERLRDYSLIDITPFPTYKLEPYKLENGQLRFHNENVVVEGPQHYSSQSLVKNDTAYINANGVRLRSSAGGSVIGSLNKGTKVTITGIYKGNNSNVNQYVWLPIRTSSGQTGWVASSYLSPKNEYLDVYRLSGLTRYETGVSISNFGWHWEQPSSVVIGRGDLPIDALTGSVLASSLDSPLLLTQNNKITASVEKELDRLQPDVIYILGGETQAISADVEKALKEKFPNSGINRISGRDRYVTALEVAKEVDKHSNVDEIFVTTGSETSSDPLAIAPYAGENNIPILLTGNKKLNENIQTYITDYGVKKVTIIGGKIAVSSTVEKQLKELVGTNNVVRVSGATRFETSTAIVDHYYGTSDIDNLFVSQGMETADALTAAPFAAKLGAPIILTLSNKLPNEVNTWLNKKVNSKPDLYFLGGSVAISENTRNQIINLVK